MKIARLVIGIVSILMSGIILLQSAAVGLGNALQKNDEVSGSAGFMLAFFMLVAGIVGIATRNSKGGSITTGCFFGLGGLIGIANVGSYADLQIWSVISFIFSAVFIFTGIKQKGNLGMKKCEECAELVKKDAKVCKHCGLAFGLKDSNKVNFDVIDNIETVQNKEKVLK